MNLKITLIFALIATISIAQKVSSEYYKGFTEALGIDTFTNDKGRDCSIDVSAALAEFKATILEDFDDADLLLESVLDIADKLKYEISPTCRTLYGDFKNFMAKYYGDAKSLIKNAEDILATKYHIIGSDINNANDAIAVGDEIEAGKSHAQILRVFFGLSQVRQADDVAEKSDSGEYLDSISDDDEVVEDSDDGSVHVLTKAENSQIIYNKFETLKKSAASTTKTAKPTKARRAVRVPKATKAIKGI